MISSLPTVDIVGTINCDEYKDNFVELYLAIKELYQPAYEPNQRIVITSTLDFYKQSHGLILQSLQIIVNNIDISNCFICFVTTNENIKQEYAYVLETYSTDSTPFDIQYIDGEFTKLPSGDIRPYTKNNSIDLRSKGLKDLTKEQKDLLFNNKNFCVLPWISLMIDTKSNVSPCCIYRGEPSGNCSKDRLEDIWNNQSQQDIRTTMLNDETVSGCSRCIHQEELGKDSLRISSNVTFLKHIHIAEKSVTPEYDIKYIDSRFNNLCNLSCRSCGHWASSSWHAPGVAIGLIDKSTPVFLKTGRSNTDLYDQILQQLDNLDRIYFAGGEPLIINDNYKILDELNNRGRYDIELVYNTNMTQTQLKGRSIFDAWKNFKKISIGASLDAEGPRGNYLRTGTVWKDVVEFRHEMIRLRPDIDFFISCTTSLINVLHVPDFHRSWVKQGLIKPEQFNIQTLTEPNWLCINTAPKYLQQQIVEKYQQHLDWLKPLDREGRATVGFESILEQLKNTIQFDPQLFWNNILPLDKYHNANLLDSFPELVDLPR
jgi:MoaA/NifB/PqqE/SkfB family radical SAM enzyme